MGRTAATVASNTERPSAITPQGETLQGTRLAQVLWDLDWANYMPVKLGNTGVTVRLTSFDAALPFIQANYAAIFEEDPESSPFKQETNIRGAKERYYRLFGDCFAFKDGSETIGLLIGVPADWSSYYIRSVAILPKFQGKKLVRLFLHEMFEALRDVGVERVDVDTSPSNFAALRLYQSVHFNPTGMVLSDRWGANVHLTKFLDDASERVFLRQYCAGVPYQRSDLRRRVVDRVQHS